MSDSESSQANADKEEKLAAAKKRFEELKKQKKKGKKGKKEVSKIETEKENEEDDEVQEDIVKVKDDTEKEEPKEIQVVEQQIDQLEPSTVVTVEKQLDLEGDQSESKHEKEEIKTGKQEPVNDDDNTETIAHLRDHIKQLETTIVSLQAQVHQNKLTADGSIDEDSRPEVDRLKEQIHTLEISNSFLSDKVHGLESQLASMTLAAKRSTVDNPGDFDSEVSLSPPPASTTDVKTKNRPRVTSFVDIDLYENASKISGIQKQMSQYNGWQLDMRNWRSLGLGPVIDI